MLEHIHLSTKIGSRKQYSSGKSTNVVRSAAYRHKTKMSGHSFFTGDKTVFDYSHLQDEFVDSFFVMNKEIKDSLKNSNNEILNMIFNGIYDLELKDYSIHKKNALLSETLWSMVEQAEKRKDAQLFREVEISLYHELTIEQNKELLRKFIKQNFTSKGMIADVVIHNSNNNNLHAHIMLTMRDFDCKQGCFGKKNRDWNKLNLVEQWRKNWASLSSVALNREIYYKSYRKMAYEALDNGDNEKANYFMELDENKANHIARSQTEELENRRFIVSNKLDEKALKLMTRYENIAQISPDEASKIDKKIELIQRELLNITTQKRVFGGFYRDGIQENIKKLREKLKFAREKIKSEFMKLKEQKFKLPQLDNENLSTALDEKPFPVLSSKKLRRR